MKLSELYFPERCLSPLARFGSALVLSRTLSSILESERFKDSKFNESPLNSEPSTVNFKLLTLKQGILLKIHCHIEKLTKTNLLLQRILNSYKTARNIKIINTGNTGLPKINNVTKINDKSTVERSLNLKFLTFIKFLIFRFKLIFIPHIFLFF